MIPEINNVEELGVKLAYMHSGTPPDLRKGILLDGDYIIKKAVLLNMPVHKEIREALTKTNNMLRQINEGEPDSFVKLWNGGENGLNAYGNPAWDLGLVLNALNGAGRAEDFMRSYLNGQGIRIAIIELFIGILYAQLDAAISGRHTEEWKRMAKEECAGILRGKGFSLKTIPNRISSEALARLGLPGINRIKHTAGPERPFFIPERQN